MERINNVEIIYTMKEQQEEIDTIVNDIKHDINKLKQEINASQGIMQLEKIDQIEKEINVFYEKMQNPEAATISQTSARTPQTSQQVYQKTTIQQQPSALQKEQVRIMNENINKFLVVYKEKNKVIEEKTKSIYILQQKLNEAEQRLKKLLAEQQDDKNKDSIIEEKAKTIAMLQQRIQEVENKFGKIVLLHKSITEKEKIKDTIIEEKNAFIASLQHKLTDIEGKLQNMILINDENKEKFLDKKLVDIDRQIQAEKKKN